MTETTKNAEMDIKALPRFSVLPDFHTINSISKIKGSLSNTRFPKTVHGGLKKKKGKSRVSLRSEVTQEGHEDTWFLFSETALKNWAYPFQNKAREEHGR